MTVSEITPAELQRRLDDGRPVRVLDIRDRTAVERWRIDGPPVSYTHRPRMKVLQAIARDDLDDLAAEIDGEGAITVVCAEGLASDEVAAALRDAGHDARNLTNGMEGWGNLYTARELPGGGEARIVQYRRPSSGCLSYGIYGDGACAVIDPLASFTDRHIADAADAGADLTYAIDTHVHADHVSGVRDLVEQTGATGVLPAGAVERGVEFDIETLADRDTIDVGGNAIEAMAAPGHTTDMTAFVVDDVLLSGDSLFVESVARPDLERTEGSVETLAQQLYETLTVRFETLDDDTLVAPGHHGETVRPGPDGTVTATLGTLRDRLWAFEADEDAFVERVTEDLGARPANYEQLIAVNLGRSAADSTDVLELELGPNNCAAAATED